jgi:RNA polymerase sigma-70 factor (ECF subfamily)
MNSTGSALIRQLQAGDPQALELLYDRLAPLVNALLLRMLQDRSEAEEIVGETFWQVWRTATSYDPSRGTVEGWVITIARSRALDRLRSRKRQQGKRPTTGEPRTTSNPEHMAVPEMRMLQSERTRAVVAALRSLSDEQRVPIELAYYEGMTQTEIATRLAEPLGTIKTRMRLGLLRLRKVLEPYLGEDV